MARGCQRHGVPEIRSTFDTESIQIAKKEVHMFGKSSGKVFFISGFMLLHVYTLLTVLSGVTE